MKGMKVIKNVSVLFKILLCLVSIGSCYLLCFGQHLFSLLIMAGDVTSTVYLSEIVNVHLHNVFNKKINCLNPICFCRLEYAVFFMGHI